MVILEAIMWAIFNSMIVAVIVLILYAVWAVLKCKATYNAHLTIINAIYRY